MLDEPLAALDIGLKEKILPYLARVRDEFGIPMIYVTHNLTEVLTLADWVLMIRQGKLVAQGAPKETLRSAHALSQLTDDEFDNVFTVTSRIESASAGTTRVRFGVRNGTVDPLSAPSGESEVSNSRERRRHSRRHRAA